MPRLGSIWAKWWRTVVFFLVAVGVVLADQASKGWVEANMVVGESRPETGFFRLLYVQNTGAAFGIFQEHTQLLTVASFVGVVVILIYALYISRRYPHLENGVSKAAIGAVLGGTVGNLIDRFNQGYVTDFLSVGSFAKFNIADASITTGIAVFIGFLIYLMVQEKQAEAARDGQPGERGDTDTRSQNCQLYRP